MAPQVETVRYIHNTEENGLTPGDLLITNTHPKGTILVIKVRRRQINHKIVIADLKYRGALTVEVNFKIVIIAAVFKAGGQGISVLYITQVVTTQLNETTPVIIKVHVEIDLGPGRH